METPQWRISTGAENVDSGAGLLWSAPCQLCDLEPETWEPGSEMSARCTVFLVVCSGGEPLWGNAGSWVRHSICDGSTGWLFPGEFCPWDGILCPELREQKEHVFCTPHWWPIISCGLPPGMGCNLGQGRPLHSSWGMSSSAWRGIPWCLTPLPWTRRITAIASQWCHFKLNESLYNVVGID